MNLWKQRTLRVAFATLVAALLTCAFQNSCLGDDYFQYAESQDQEVQVASDIDVDESALTVIAAEPVSDEPALHEMENHHADDGMSDWVDPTFTETCPCTQGESGSCPGVCKDPGHPKKPKHPRPGDIDEGDCPSKRYRMDDCLRSGDPNCVYKWAAPSITSKYSAWYVGGGAAFKGRGRKASEGTWGLDYDGLFGHARTWLNYSCGKEQGGEGAYETDHVPLKKKL